MAPELAVVVPTLNEADNVVPLFERLRAVLDGIAWEVVFVDDDSSDGTGEVLERLARSHDNVRYLRRIGRHGLSSASLEGMLASTADCLAVIDADLQHDETLLPEMLDRLKREDLDLVVASRYVSGGDLGDLSGGRRRLSRLGTAVSRRLMRADVKDPLSGFFVLRRSLLDEVVHDLSVKGFKILLDIFASARRPLRFGEVPMQMRRRHSGSSKLDTLVSLEFALLLADKLVGKVIPPRFVLFVAVGLFGVAVHLLGLGVFFKVLELRFYGAQAAATVIAMTVNFYLNNIFTFRSRRLYGTRFLWGLLSFYAVCSIGALANFQLAQFLFDLGVPWLLAGFLGAVVGSVWNYGVTSTFTWQARMPKPPGAP